MLVIFTDLDGTLLEPGTCSWAAARPALRRLARLQVPLVFCSSKTRAEILFWRRRLGNGHPFISENGGGIFMPTGLFPGLEGLPRIGGLATIAFGTPYAQLRLEIVRLRRRLGVAVRGFGDMTVSEVAALTGLSLFQARLARQRDFDEPFVFQGRGRERFLRAIEASGRNWTRGELYHLLGDHDKGRAVGVLLEHYRPVRGLKGGREDPIVSAALGDGLNDLPMLRRVDRPFLVGRPGGDHAAGLNFPGLVRTRGAGPVGWNEAVMALLDEFAAGPAARARGSRP